MNTASPPAECFGTVPNGGRATLHTLSNEHLRVRITDFGGRLVSVEAPDRNGLRDDVVLGFDSAPAYAHAGGAFGALLGRTANRIAGGRFTLDGQVYELSRNEGSTTLHGGVVGFDKVLWRIVEVGPACLVLAHVSPDGDQGFPGQLSVRASYRLDGSTIWLALEAETTRATPVSLSAHPYFNLAGPASADILDHEATLEADVFLPTDKQQIPTGELRSVSGTAFDFRQPRRIGAHIRQADEQLLLARGYDHYFVLNGTPEATLRPAARIWERRSGRVLEVLTTHPGVQFYSGNNLNGSVAGRGGAYRQSAGFAIEPQGFPDAPNQRGFPSSICRPGETYRSAIAYRFTTS